jgi:hypothetical protein
MSKFFLLRFVATCLSLAFLVFSVGSCGEDEPEPQQGPSITSFSPAVGLPGTVVTISGKNFDATAANNTVKFSSIVATVSEATATSLKVTVPADAVTGRIEVITNNMSAISPADFVIPPVVTDFSPESGVAGSEITITGKGFSSTAANNIVTFSGVTATVTAASATSLTVQVPTAGYTGTISVQIGSASVTTTEVFKYLPVITGFDPTSGPIDAEITITGSGFDINPESNIVKIGNVAAKVLSSMANQLVIKVAEGTETGLITVSSGGAVATSVIPYTIIVEAWSAGGTDFDAGYSIGLDAAGNSYVAGSFVGTATFGETILTGAGEEIFVAKYDLQGELVWAVSAGGADADRAISIVVDNAGNSYITGNIAGGAQFGSLPPVTASGYDAFVTKLNTSGEFQWVQSFGSGDTDMSRDVALDNDGNPIIVGNFHQTVDIGATELVSPGGSTAFVAAFHKSDGSPMWAKAFGGTFDEHGTTVTVNKDGDIYVGASFFGTVTIGTQIFNAGANLNSFVLKLDDVGELLWAKQISGSNWNNVLDLAADANGNCVMTGYYTDQVTIAGVQLSGMFNEDIFFAKLESADGDGIFVKKAGGYDYENGMGVAIDGAGNIYLAGYYTRDAVFNTETVTSKVNSRDAFIAKYNSEGTLSWVKSAGGNENDQANAVCVGADGKIYLTGSFRDVPAKFGATVLDNVGSDDVFVYRIMP